MKLLVAGYSQDETHRVSAELRSAGHQVLGALGRSGARTFVKVVTPDLVVVPVGEADTVRGWIADLEVGALRWVLVGPGEDPVGAVAAAPAEEAPSPVERTPSPVEVAPAEVEVEAAEVELEAPRPVSARRPTPVTDVADVSFEPPSASRGGARSRPTGITRRKVGSRPLDPGIPPGDDSTAAPVDAADGAREADAGPPPVPAGAAADPGAAPRSEAAPVEGGAPPSDLVSKLAQTRFGDYHSILEVEPGASPYAVREQYTRLSRLYSPRGWPRRLGPEELEILQEVASGIRDAYLILGEPELRARYERALLGGGGSPTTRR